MITFSFFLTTVASANSVTMPAWPDGEPSPCRSIGCAFKLQVQKGGWGALVTTGRTEPQGRRFLGARGWRLGLAGERGVSASPPPACIPLTPRPTRRRWSRAAVACSPGPLLSGSGVCLGRGYWMLHAEQHGSSLSGCAA